MVVCVNCNHDNPEGATLCETCYTPLPINTRCPNCNSSILSNATFCGQCGFNLLEQNTMAIPNEQSLENENESGFCVPELQVMSNKIPESEENLSEELEFDLEETNVDPITVPDFDPSENPVTKLQTQRASLLHIQTNKKIELPANLQVIHLGKENDKIPPDIDVSGFPNSQFVSRIHADIRVEVDAFYLEDTGSANGTYVNHIPLPQGNRHRLKSGDRIALGKEDKVSFIFQLPS